MKIIQRFKIIIFFIPHNHIGGAERVHLNIIKCLYYKPIVFFDYSDSNKISEDFKDHAYCFLITNKRRIKYAFKFINIISYIFPVIVFGSNSRIFYDFISRLNRRVKSIDLTHAFSYFEKSMETISIPFVDLLDKRIVINQKTKNDYEQLYLKNNIDKSLLSRFDIISNGIEICDFVHKVDSRFENFTIGYVGRNSPEKRPELFFDIVAKLDVKAKVIGDNFDIYKKNFPNVDYFENCNVQEKIREQFLDISLLIVSSSREGFPLVIMEAMELGIPVISANVGSISEHVINNFNGFIVPVEEGDFLKFSISHILSISQNKELYNTLSLNARDHAVANFNMENFKTKYRKLFYE